MIKVAINGFGRIGRLVFRFIMSGKMSGSEKQEKNTG